MSTISQEQLLLLTMGIFVVAVLYSSVGHAGASGYIATMSLAGLAPEAIKPTALVLNVMVASIASWQFWKAGHFSWRLFWPFVVLAIPFAFLGGYLNLPSQTFKILLGIVLLFSAMRFLAKPVEVKVKNEVSRVTSIPVGGGLGFLAGLTGTGGGIFLTPLLLIMSWATAKQAAAVSALFILVNSISGLLGNLSSTERIPNFAIPFAIAAIVGGTIGSHLGSERLQAVAIKRLLTVVLLIAGTKLIFTA